MSSFCLTSEQVKQRAEIARQLRNAYEELGAAVRAYNLVVVGAKAFADEVASDAQSAHDEKSERWQESDAASEVTDWIQEWENLELEEIDEPDESAVDSFESIDDHRPMRKARAKKVEA